MCEADWGDLKEAIPTGGGKAERSQLHHLDCVEIIESRKPLKNNNKGER